MNLQLLLFSFTFSSAYCIYCHRCDSSKSYTCVYDKYTTCGTDLTECSSQTGLGFLDHYVPRQCVKIVAYLKNGGEHVARGCMPNLVDDCHGIAKVLGFFPTVPSSLIEDMKCYTCHENKCNSATKFRYFKMLGVIIASIVFLL